ncbi:hypothetical protein [Bacteroides sp.]|uniref:hypothetical protein n=1 Tax=Bacteroides sp. TaxID=29523 RepID=UPI003AB54BF4
MINQGLKDAYINEAMSFIDDEAMMIQALQALRNIKMQRTEGPCRYSVEELQTRLEQSEVSIRAGRTFTTEELRKRHPICE